MSKKTVDQFRDPLEDRGWQQMRVLLDQEMPEKKRRFIWWPLAGAAAVIVLLSGFLLLSNNQQNKDILSSQTNSLNTGNTQEDKTSLLDDLTKNDVPGPEQNSSVSLEIQKSSENSSVVSKNRTSVNTFAESISSNTIKEATGKIRVDPEKITEVTGKISSANDESDQLITEDVLTGHLIQTDADGEANAQYIRARQSEILMPLNEKFSLLTYLYGLNTDEIFNSGQIAVDPPVQIKRKSRFDLSLSSALISDAGLNKISYDVGAQLRYRPLKKVAIALGAYFWKIRSEQTFTATTKVANPGVGFQDQNDALLVAIPEMEADSIGRLQAGNVTYVRTIKKLSYLKVPLVLHFFPNQKWQPYIGVNYMFLLSDGRNGLLENNTQYDFASNGAGSNSIYVSELVRGMNRGFLIGIGYQSGNHLAFDLSYTHSGKSYLNYPVTKGTFNEYHRFIRFGLNYRF